MFTVALALFPILNNLIQEMIQNSIEKDRENGAGYAASGGRRSGEPDGYGGEEEPE